TSLTLSSGDLTKITNPDLGVRTFTYSSHRMTDDQYGPNLETNYAYTSYGTVGTITLGTSNSPTTVTFNPVILQGIGTTAKAGAIFGSTTDAVGAVSQWQVDSRSKPVQMIQADGSGAKYTYDSNGYLKTVADALNRVTTYTNDAQGYQTKVAYADGTSI